MKNQPGFFSIKTLKSDERRPLVFQSVLGFSILAHLFRYTNTAFNSDSLGIFRGGRDIWLQIGRGRWLQPLYLYIRGELGAPFLIGLLATLYLAISILLMLEILGIRDRPSIIVLCGLLTVAPSITITNAAYVPWSDIFMLSLLFSMISGYFLTKASGKCRYLIGGVFLILSLALYQAYIGACMLICLFFLLRRSLEGDKIENIIKSAAAMTLVFALSLILYYCSFRVICAAMSIEPSDSYNSVASATVLSGNSRLPVLIMKAYRSVFRYMIRPETFHSTLAGCIHIFLLSIAGVLLFLSVRNNDAGRIVAILLLVLLCPLAAYFIYLLFGRDDTLLTFPIAMLYVGIGMLFEIVPQESSKRCVGILSKTALLFASVLIFFGTVYSNQVYLKKSVEEQETLSLMTRVLYHMEQTEGYTPGETKVALVGSLLDSEAYAEKQGYGSMEGRTLENEISIMYYNNYRMYLNNILGYPINLIDQHEAKAIGQKQEVEDMPAFPHSGCTMMMDDILVVKLSDTDN